MVDIKRFKNPKFISLLIMTATAVLIILSQLKTDKPEAPKFSPRPDVLGDQGIEKINLDQKSTPSPTFSPTQEPTPAKSDKNKCCFSPETGQKVEKPHQEKCLEFTIVRETKADLDSLADTIEKETGLILISKGKGEKLNGAISAQTVNNVYRYEIRLYQSDAIDYEQDPPYTYQSTDCTPEIQEKLTKIVDKLSGAAKSF